MCANLFSSHVTKVEFLDVSTLVSADSSGSTKFWDISTGTCKDTVAGENFALSTSSGTEERAGRFLVTSKGDMVLVHHHADGGEASDGEKAPVAFFSAPAPVQTISFSDDKIGVGCTSGAVLHLRARWLVDT